MNDVELHHMSRNASVELWRPYYRGHEVPYLAVYKVPVDTSNQQVFDRDGDPLIDSAQWDGPFRWELSVDDRWAYDFGTREEIEEIIPIVADAMAVAAGYACHGSAIAINRHGPNEKPQTTDSAPSAIHG